MASSSSQTGHQDESLANSEAVFPWPQVSVDSAALNHYERGMNADCEDQRIEPIVSPTVPQVESQYFATD